MRVCLVQMFGLGNGVMTTPLVKALHSLGHQIDVVVNPDRATRIVFEDWECVSRIHDHTSREEYDHVFFCHPDYFCPNVVPNAKKKTTLEISVQGAKDYMSAFKKHEVEYLMDFAYDLGYEGDIPPLRKLPSTGDFAFSVGDKHPRPVAVGIGYLKDNAFWVRKHWGNDNYLQLCEKLWQRGFLPVIVGDTEDRLKDGNEIEAACSTPIVNTAGRLSLSQVFGLLEKCAAYVGNDSGLGHAGAAQQTPVISIFMPNASNPVKNRPWCERYRVLYDPTPREVLDALTEIL